MVTTCTGGPREGRGAHGSRTSRSAPCFRGIMTQPSQPRITYARRLGLFSATMAVMGGIIGSGVFLGPQIVAARVGGAGLTLVAWVVGGVIALTGAFCFGELGARRPAPAVFCCGGALLGGAPARAPGAGGVRFRELRGRPPRPAAKRDAAARNRRD